MTTNRELLFPYAAPYFSYVILASTIGKQLSPEIDYLLRISVCAVLLLWAWKWYAPLWGPQSPISSCITGVVVGLAGTVLWIIFLTPFVDPLKEVEAWSISAFSMRLIAAGIVVPLAEEIVMRRYVFCLALQWYEFRLAGHDSPLLAALDEASLNDVKPGLWSWPAVLVSTFVFASGHHVYEWPASVVYGLLMSGLLIFRKDLLSCVVAHGVTNVALGVYVYFDGHWYLW